MILIKTPVNEVSETSLVELVDGGDSTVHELFQEHIENMQGEQCPRNVILNLNKISFIDSFSLGLIVCLHKKLQNKKGNLILIKPTGDIGKLMEITKLDRLFKIADDVDSALRFLHE